MKFIRKLARVPAPVVLEGVKFDPSDVADLVRCYSFTEVASILGISVKTLRAHVKAGRIRVMDVGTTGKRPRRKIQGYSIQSFIRKQKVRETEPCPSTKGKTLPSMSTTSKSTAVAFTDLQAQKASAKLSASKTISSGKPGSKPVKQPKLTKTVP
jgi:hypothetical protein